jgi:hypothetical protein
LLPGSPDYLYPFFGSEWIGKVQPGLKRLRCKIASNISLPWRYNVAPQPCHPRLAAAKFVLAFLNGLAIFQSCVMRAVLRRPHSSARSMRDLRVARLYKSAAAQNVGMTLAPISTGVRLGAFDH